MLLVHTHTSAHTHLWPRTYKFHTPRSRPLASTSPRPSHPFCSIYNSLTSRLSHKTTFATSHAITS